MKAPYELPYKVPAKDAIRHAIHCVISELSNKQETPFTYDEILGALEDAKREYLNALWASNESKTPEELKELRHQRLGIPYNKPKAK